MVIWYCDDNLARQHEVLNKLSEYDVKTYGRKEAERRIEQARPAALVVHTSCSTLLEKAGDVPAIVVTDEESTIEDLRNISCRADVVELEQINEGLQKILPRSYDITRTHQGNQESARHQESTPQYQLEALNRHKREQLVYTDYEHYVRLSYDTITPLNRCEIVLIASGKGGVGKTTITACLAQALARKQVATCAVDLDIKCPTLGAVLQIDHNRGVGELIKAPENVGDAFMDDLLVTHRSGARLLLPSGTVKLSGNDVIKIVRNLVRKNEVVIIDVGIARDEYVRACADIATKIFLVTKLTAPSLQKCKEWLAEIAPRDKSKVYLLVNMYGKMSAFPPTAAHRIMGINLAGTLPWELKVEKGEGNGNPLPERSAFAREIMNLADVIWPWKQWKEPGGGLLAGIRGLFGK
ncbi:AAA family ATPase [Desulfurispora thermophila]|uniref:AAA family ATPase n=1 Tax=Desulfurispora thermophila TaxID=265470 RepID=UPI0003810EAF|nr:P-loop NTPase [Desulfurispora thermophila]